MEADMDLRWAGCVTAALLFVSACGAQDAAKPAEKSATAQPNDDAVKKAQAEADAIVRQQMAGMQRKEASTFPCSLFAQQEIEALAGNPLDPGSHTFNHVDEDGRRYRSESCDWSAKGGEGHEAGLWVSLPKHFDSGKVECSPRSANTQIDGIGDRAWWDFQKYFGLGTLRVCSTKAMLEVKVDLTGNDEAAARAIAWKMAEKVLASQ
jgi:hypothetical protein